MIIPSPDDIRKNVAENPAIYARGVRLYEHGAFALIDGGPATGRFEYQVDGRYGDYITTVSLQGEQPKTSCDCPYPLTGCKHTVAALLDARDQMAGWREPRAVSGAQKKAGSLPDGSPDADAGADAAEDAVTVIPEYLTPEELRTQVIEDRARRARSEKMTLIQGDMLKGDHVVKSASGQEYEVTFHDPAGGKGHCSCPDYLTNRLGVCKHLMFAHAELKKSSGMKQQAASERFPFADIYLDSETGRPRLFLDRPELELTDAGMLLRKYFSPDGDFLHSETGDLLPLMDRLTEVKSVYIREPVIERMDQNLMDRQLKELAAGDPPEITGLNTALYPYQEKGVRFGLFRKATLIGDEMGLGKTLQAIALGLMKQKIFGFDRILVVTMASLKEQWKREIERFTDETAMVVAGSPKVRRHQYLGEKALFRITNYEAVLRDGTILERFKPDLVILDEAQRIKNFNTKTADAVKRIPRKHSLVLTGTPLENKLEDVYSILQFLDPELLSPLWQFSADHFLLSRTSKNKILGYRNLDLLKKKLAPVVIRRRKEEVLTDLPDTVTNTYFVDMSPTQQDMHQGYAASLAPLLSKKFLTPVDHRRIQMFLLKMRQACNSTYLIDRETQISPKLDELKGILEELVVENNRKAVIFSEWTTMTFLIGKMLSTAGIKFVELTGKIPVKKRQALIDEFSNNPDCGVFLSTDAGGTGLNLQAADCVINFEPPWNPSRLNQRIGRVNRIGQKSKCVNVVNLISRGGIEERITAGLQLKTQVFEGVFQDGASSVIFSAEKKGELLNRLREMMGEEPTDVRPDPGIQEELPEDTPHFLNPEALMEEDPETDLPEHPDVPSDEAGAPADDRTPGGYAVSDGDTRPAPEGGSESTGGTRSKSGAAAILEAPPEQIESVLDTGMRFIGGLLEMATGQNVTPTAESGKLVEFDKDTGEVTLKFKLPGF